MAVEARKPNDARQREAVAEQELQQRSWWSPAKEPITYRKMRSPAVARRARRLLPPR